MKDPAHIAVRSENEPTAMERGIIAPAALDPTRMLTERVNGRMRRELADDIREMRTMIIGPAATSHSTSQHAETLQDVVEQLQSQVRVDEYLAARSKQDAVIWVRLYRKFRGRMYVFRNRTDLLYHRPWLEEILRDQHPHGCVRKSRQCGASETMLHKSLWFCDTHDGSKVVHTFPRGSQASTWSNTRVAPALRELPVLKEKMRSVDNVLVKAIGLSMYMLKSSWEEELGEGIDVDFLILDEKDRMSERAYTAFDETLTSSRWGWRWEIGCPTVPGRGIDKTWAASDQRLWLVSCGACGKEQPLKYPANIKQVHEYDLSVTEVPLDAYVYVCKFCDSERINRLDGRWEAQQPGRDIHGYQINQLMCPWISAVQIMQKKRDYRFVQLWFNYVLGEPDVSEAFILTPQDVAACVAPGSDIWPPITQARPKTCQRISVGIDWGNINWVVVLGRSGPEVRILSAWWVEDGEDPMQSAHAIVNYIRPMNPDIIIADLGYGKFRIPVIRQAYPSKTYACYYSDTERGVGGNAAQFSQSQFTLRADRVISLKDMARVIRSGCVRGFSPSLASWGVFGSHLTALASAKELDEDSNEVLETIVSTGPDHFAHALNYALLGLTHLTGPVGLPGAMGSRSGFLFLEEPM